MPLRSSRRGKHQKQTMPLWKPWEQSREPKQTLWFAYYKMLGSERRSSIVKRIKTTICAKLREEHVGFQVWRSCSDQIVALCIIHYHGKISGVAVLYIIFIEFRKAFTVEYRRVCPWALWHSSKDHQCDKEPWPRHQLQSHTKCWSVGTFQCKYQSQGCLLSPNIFLIVIEWVMTTTMDQPRGIE